MSIFGIRDSSIKVVTSGLTFWMDSARLLSYPRTGTTVTNLFGTQTGTLTNGASFDSTIKGGTFALDGTDDYVSFSSVPLGSSASDVFTWSVWVYIRSWGGGLNSFLSIGNATCAFYYGSGGGGTSTYLVWINSINSFGPSTSNSLITGAWTNVVATYDRFAASNRCQIYLNGSALNPINLSGATGLGSTAALGVGQNAPPFVSYGNNYVSEVMIYSRVLSSTEVLQNYNATKARYI